MKKKKTDWDLVAWAVMAIVGIILGTLIVQGGSSLLKGGNSEAKEYCAERAESASNSYAAKKIYKACMSNY